MSLCGGVVRLEHEVVFARCVCVCVCYGSACVCMSMVP
jgi:hypothetical protein